MREAHFERFWETTLSPATPQSVVAHWRQNEFSAVHRGVEVVDRIKAYTPLHGRHILDLGCGYGGLSIALAIAGALVVGLDVEAKRLKGATIRSRGDHPDCRVEWVQAQAEDLPFADNSFDVIVCVDVLEHVSSHAGALTEIARALRPGGWLYLQFPNRLSPGNLRQDPHYGLFGVSILPRRLGELYVVKVRRRSRSYEVGTFPVAHRVFADLSDLGFRIADWSPAPRRRIGWLTPLLRAYRLDTVPLVTAVCRG